MYTPASVYTSESVLPAEGICLEFGYFSFTNIQ